MDEMIIIKANFKTDKGLQKEQQWTGEWIKEDNTGSKKIIQ